jgi:hypothetical protein
MSFASRITGINSVALSRFANATALSGEVAIPVIFNATHKGVQLFDGEVSSSNPNCTMAAATAAANNLDNGSSLTITCAELGITSQAYTIIDVQPDGAGLVVLPLTEA